MKRHLPRIAVVLALASFCAACHKDGLASLNSNVSAPGALDFGIVTVGTTKTLSLTVSNEAAFVIDFTGAQVAAPFTVSTGPQSINSAGTISVAVTFAPATEQDYAQTLTLSFSSLDTPQLTVALTGHGEPVGQACSGGCAPGFLCCGNVCTDVQNDPTHCGACNKTCPPGDLCQDGDCKTPTQPPSGCDDLTNPCSTGQKCCNHACVQVGSTGLCPCSGGGNKTTFGGGTIIIPMDSCWQKGKDVTAIPSDCNPRNAKATGDDSPLKAYGLVFFLLRHQVTVYMGINPAKSAIDGIDLTLTSFSGTAPVSRYDWGSKTFTTLPDDSDYEVNYRGAPFIIDSSQHDRVLQLLANDPDFQQFRDLHNITIHVSKEQFSSAIAKQISVVPSRVALLSPTGDTQSYEILVNYLKSAGLNFTGAGGTPDHPGQIYDQLNEDAFLPNYANSKLKSGGYKLLWAPHWDGGTTKTAAQLASIADYVNAGGDLFAECAAIGTLEGISGTGFGTNYPGTSATRFQTDSGLAGNTFGGPGGGGGGTIQRYLYAGLASPFVQKGDFPFAGFTGRVQDYHPASGSSYYSDVTRMIWGQDNLGRTSDFYTYADQHSTGKGTVVYLAGHDYSYDGRSSSERGVTAGSRLVLNTLFSLGTNDACAP